MAPNLVSRGGEALSKHKRHSKPHTVGDDRKGEQMAENDTIIYCISQINPAVRLVTSFHLPEIRDPSTGLTVELTGASGLMSPKRPDGRR